MNLKGIDNKPHRDGFDLSKKLSFTSKFGELLPIYSRLVIPGDKFKIDLNNFTRTRPLKTASFVRARQYYDWVFVPFDQMWKYAPAFFSDTGNQIQSAQSITGTQKIGDVLPWASCKKIKKFLNRLLSDLEPDTYYEINQSLQPDKYANYWGANRGLQTLKLFDLLGLQAFCKLKTVETPKPHLEIDWDYVDVEDIPVNLFKLMAYQKYYSDYVRFSQWEDAQPETYNVDYLCSPNFADMEIRVDFLDSLDIKDLPHCMFDMNYCNMPKDMLFGVLPNSQFGAKSMVSTSINDFRKYPETTIYGEFQNFGTADSGPSTNATSSLGPTGGVGALTGPSQKASYKPILSPEAIRSIARSINATYQSQFSILALRQAEAVQRLKEIKLSNEQNYKAQIEALFGVHVSSFLEGKSFYLDGISQDIDISSVVNTNLADQSSQQADQATIQGNGTASGSKFINFESNGNFGILLCIYHAVTYPEYSLDGITPDNMITHYDNIANPVFDRLGLEEVPYSWFTKEGFTHDPQSFWSEFLGYGPRYLEYKTDIDTVHGDFNLNCLGSDPTWNAPINPSYMKNEYITPDNYPSVDTDDKYITADYFRYNPMYAKPIFYFDPGNMPNSDYLLNTVYLDIKAVRNLDRTGMPY